MTTNTGIIHSLIHLYKSRPKPIERRHIVWGIKHVVLFIPSLFFGQIGRIRARRAFKDSDFVGAYEKRKMWNGIYIEQWLWANKHLIKGKVLDMSSPREMHEFIYNLPWVDEVLISDLDQTELKVGDSISKVDIIGDFSVDELPVSDNSFDTVLCLSILEHCEDPLKMVANIRKILRDNGCAFFYTPFAYIDGHTGQNCPDNWRFCRDGYKLLAEKAGFKIVSIGDHLDLGKYYFLEFGWSAAKKSWHNGVPMSNWMICEKNEQPK